MGNDLVRHNDWWRLDFATAIEESHRPRIGLFPNPTTGPVTVTWPAEWPNARISMFDALGRLVLDQHVNHGTLVDVSALAPGRYVMEARYGSTQLRGNLTKLP